VVGVKDAHNHLLSVCELKTYFFTDRGISRAVDGVSFSISRGHTLGLVGESGCGKTVTALSILRLVPHPPGRIVSGSILFKGHNLVGLCEKEMEKIRGEQISMIFQEPMTSLNPVFTIGNQVAEVFQIHRGLSRRAAWRNAVEMLERVKIPEPAKRAREYPHQMSGGMRQRVMIAIALACEPDLLIADEPTTALDVTVQAQILNLMEELKKQYDSAILLITHNLGVIAEIADEVAVMYAGMIVEYAPVEILFGHPFHPYTRGLLLSIPELEEIRRGKRLVPIEGNVPEPTHHPPGCRFHPRCPKATSECRAAVPQLVPADSGAKHLCRCIHPYT